MNSSVVWKRWVKDLRTLQRACARDGYQMLVSVKLHPTKKRAVSRKRKHPPQASGEE